MDQWENALGLPLCLLWLSRTEDRGYRAWRLGAVMMLRGNHLLAAEKTGIRASRSKHIFGIQAVPKQKKGFELGYIDRDKAQNPNEPRQKWLAILHCAKEIIRQRPLNWSIAIFSDSQSAPKAISFTQVTSKLVGDCLKVFTVIVSQNRLTLAWVPGHQEADKQARKGAPIKPEGLELFCGLAKTCIRTCIKKMGEKRVLGILKELPTAETGQNVHQRTLGQVYGRPTKPKQKSYKDNSRSSNGPWAPQ
ncbi:hypothetical protein NQ317_004116 [Molorchus minor]|uniref:RNase H type-1 domain-containing protein n=1 Tax=Molorchus minor TaxID=1323400 RepID=A0ABQ9IRP3_9CUCU|nr:hypothetical protein NQ317_004116 [Molorchus minor]